VVNPFFGSNHRKEAATVTPADIIYSRRCHVIERAAIVGVTKACRDAGVSRTSYYRWTARAECYGLSALMPKGRRRPAMPSGIPAHEEEIVLAEAIARPTLGARRLLEHLAERDVHRSASGVQKVLHRHHLGTRKLRVAALAALTAADTGLVAPRALEPYGFCLFASRPGQLVGLDAFYVGKLKGIGPIWQLTAVDTATRWAFCSLMVGHVSAKATGAFVKELAKETWKVGILLQGVLTDNGPEFIGQDFREALTELKLAHHRTPPRSPDYNAIVERFHETVLHECYRPAFHRRRFDRLADLDAVLRDFLQRYNRRRRNHGDYMNSRTPLQVLQGVKR
jgi:transposase InsO family protein